MDHEPYKESGPRSVAQKIDAVPFPQIYNFDDFCKNLNYRLKGSLYLKLNQSETTENITTFATAIFAFSLLIM